MKQRFEYIDRLKGFAILCVIMGHFQRWVFRMPNDPIHDFIYLYHMPLFIFLSGIVIGMAPSFKKDIIKAFQFLCPFFIIGCFAYSYFIHSDINGFISSHFKCGYWYLLTLAYMYFLLIPFRWTNGLNDRKGVIKDLSLAVAILIGLKCANVFLPFKLADSLGVTMVLEYWSFFILGYLVRKYNLANWLMEHNWFMSIAMLLIIPTSLIYFRGYGHVFTLVAFLFIVVLLYLFKSRENATSFVEKELARLGRGTLDIYIYHYFLLNLLNLKVAGAWLESSNNMLLTVLLYVVVSGVIAYISLGFGHMIKKSNIINDVVYGNGIKKFFAPSCEKNCASPKKIILEE